MAEFACPECGKKIKNRGALGIHRKGAHGVASPFKESLAMVTPNPNETVTRAELTIRDLQTEIVRLKGENQQLLDQANGHRRLGELINHAGEACADCQHDLEDHNRRVIQGALENIDPQVLRKLAISRGVLPSSFSFNLP